MAVAAAPRLPGIAFETPSPRLDEALPRMDVAAFVGFAFRGPLQVPVLVDDVRRFEAVFGGELRLAWDRARGQWVTAHLARAVHAFFANGGQRCWVVRVAGYASVAEFSLPGIAHVVRTDAGAWAKGDARARASSPGSWADAMRASTRQRSFPLGILAVARVPGVNGRFALEVIAGRRIEAGDLVKARDAQGTADVFLVVESVTRGSRLGQFNLVVAWPLHCKGDELSDADPVARPLEPMAHVVRLDLLVRLGQAASVRNDLGFAMTHARCWRSPRAGEALDLGGVATPAASDEAAAFDVPMAMGSDFGGEAQAENDGRAPLERDGLGAFSPGLFVDAALEGIAARDLMEAADVLRYCGPKPRPLIGMHAVLGWNDSPAIEEVSMVAVPDAVHRPWVRAGSVGLAGPSGSIIPGAGELQHCTFDPCDGPPLPKPQWNLPLKSPGQCAVKFEWQAPPLAEAGEFVLEESALPDFSVIDSTLRTRRTEATLHDRAPGVSFHRVRLEQAGVASENSDTLRMDFREAREFEVAEEADQSALLAVHRSLLRLCAARADLFAVLALPRDMREGAAAGYARTLAGSLDDERVASFGAVYHPWPIGRSASGALADTPPDGAATGVLARRALGRGAWIAPANEGLRGVVALAPELAGTSGLELQEARVNVVRREPAGFTVLDADTLSPDPALRAIAVRRLLSLLRRVLLRAGNELAFEPNDAGLRSAAERRLERVLERLWRRGAFAGKTPDTSFQVNADLEANPPEGVERGRLVVEVRVCPAQALRFLTVRLVQSGTAGVLTEEA